MLPRIAKLMLAMLVAVGVFRAEIVHAQHSIPPLHQASLEWLVADSDVVVRGMVVDVAADQERWNIVTLDVLETLKGAKAERVKFAVHRFGKGDAALARAKQAKQESLWLLKRQGSGVPGDAPDREKLLARHQIDLHASFLPGRPDDPALPMIPLGMQEQPPALLTMDLRLLKSSDDLVKAIRAAVGVKSSIAAIGSYDLALPQEIAQRTGFSRPQNRLAVPVDGRLEEVARRLVQSPADFLAKGEPDHRYLLRVEGVKALRRFPSEKNLALVRAWLDDPNSTTPVKADQRRLVPALPKSQKTETKVALPVNLADVPEIHFQRPLTKAMKTADAQLHTAVTIDGVHLLNHKKRDAFIETLMSKRPDLAGLSFAMGDACRMKPEASRQFVAALEVFRTVEDSKQKEDTSVTQRYQARSSEKKIDPSASVATLMQVLAPEDGKTRLGLAKYLSELPNAEATRALAKLAIFSEEPEVRTAAIDALKKRDAKDCTEILLAGLTYPWPAVAEWSGEAIAKLGRKDLLPQLIAVLEQADPRAPRLQERSGGEVPVVRELVRLNHHHNCLLCHAPATATRENASKEDIAKLEALTAQVPVPSESMVAYYRPSSPDILVRFDVTYLRQDFSMKLKVADADPWPEMQRYDFLVRTREVTAEEAAAYRKLLQSSPGAMSPYRRAALTALRSLTGLDAEPTAAAWRKLTGI